MTCIMHVTTLCCDGFKLFMLEQYPALQVMLSTRSFKCMQGLAADLMAVTVMILCCGPPT